MLRTREDEGIDLGRVSNGKRMGGVRKGGSWRKSRGKRGRKRNNEVEKNKDLNEEV